MEGRQGRRFEIILNAGVNRFKGIVSGDGKLLLIREKAERLWSLPGGWADVCESVGENVVREIAEESGFQTRAVRLLAVLDRSKHPHQPPFINHVYKIFVLCEITGGIAFAAGETDGVVLLRRMKFRSYPFHG